MEEGENEASTSKTLTTTAAAGGGGGGGYNGENAKRARLKSTLTAMLQDPILSDVPNNPTLSDVDTLISLELGSAMRITVLKLDSTSFDVVLMNNATVKDLKLAIKRKVNEMEQSKMGHRHISCGVCRSLLWVEPKYSSYHGLKHSSVIYAPTQLTF